MFILSLSPSTIFALSVISTQYTKRTLTPRETRMYNLYKTSDFKPFHMLVYSLIFVITAEYCFRTKDVSLLLINSSPLKQPGCMFLKGDRHISLRVTHWYNGK